MSDDKPKPRIAEDEYAVKLTQDITGGLGNHEAGTVLRALSFSAFNTLTCGGSGFRVKTDDDGNILPFDDAAVAAEEAQTKEPEAPVTDVIEPPAEPPKGGKAK